MELMKIKRLITAIIVKITMKTRNTKLRIDYQLKLKLICKKDD
jgi:hypothetical protein